MAGIHPEKNNLLPDGISNMEVSLLKITGTVRGVYYFIAHVSYNGNDPISQKLIVKLRPFNHCDYAVSNFLVDTPALSEKYQAAMNYCKEAIDLLNQGGWLKDKTPEDETALKMLAIVSKKPKVHKVPQEVINYLMEELKGLIKGRYLMSDRHGRPYLYHPEIGNFELTFSTRERL